MAASFQTARVLLQSKDSVKRRSKVGTVFERNIDAVETFHLASSSVNARNGRRNFHLTVPAKLRVDPKYDVDVEHARSAWISLRQRHPALASLIHGSKRIYQKFQPGHIQSYLPATEMPAMYLLPEPMVFALRTSHYLMDALGAEARSLPSASISQLARLWNVRRRWLWNYPTVGVVELEYMPASTKALVVKARKHNMSVTHVLHAGVAFAAKEYGPFMLTRNYNSVIIVDQRRCRAEQLQSPSQAQNGIGNETVSAQHAMWPISVPVTSFWKTAEESKTAYQDASSDPDLPALIEPTFAEVLSLSSTRPPPDRPSYSSTLILGSCDRIDDFLESTYEGLTVGDFSISARCSGEEVVVLVWTYQEKLRIRVMFNEGSHSAKGIERYLHLVQVALRNGVGVSPTSD
ncbi:uncharacterized protein BDV17DRAFT_284813 [Aspergillus undulatus]|uniref:uncharacterized protein n=1 Tax=Aspergillus undulatus TaxID=1810928 RepID=UPI003CCDA7B3